MTSYHDNVYRADDSAHPAVRDPASFPPGTYPCRRPRCLTCEMLKNMSNIKISDRQTLEIRHHMTCSTVSVIYLITCLSCSVAYVGETGQELRKRMNNHRAAIRNGEDTPVGVHFQTSGHRPKVSGLQVTKNDILMRRTVEKTWIKRLRESTEYRCLNRDEGMDILSL